MTPKYSIALIAFIVLFSSVDTLTTTTEAQAVRGNRAKRTTRVVKRHRTAHKVHRRVTRRAHLHYHGLPLYRKPIAVVPTTAVVVSRDANRYHYHDGIFYRSDKTGFVVVRPARGIRVRVLPARHRRVVVGKRTYFYYYGVYYQKPANSDEHEVVDAPVGALVDALPEGYNVKEVDGTEYYEFEGDYYQEIESDEFESGVGYEVVKI